MNGGVQQRQLFQGFADHSQHNFRLYGNRLANNLSRYLNAKGQQIISDRLIELRDAALKILKDFRQKQSLLASHGLSRGLPGGRAGGIAGLMPLLSCLFVYPVSLFGTDHRQSWLGRRVDGRLDSRIKTGEFPALPSGEQ